MFVPPSPAASVSETVHTIVQNLVSRPVLNARRRLTWFAPHSILPDLPPCLTCGWRSAEQGCPRYGRRQPPTEGPRPSRRCFPCRVVREVVRDALSRFRSSCVEACSPSSSEAGEHARSHGSCPSGGFTTLATVSSPRSYFCLRVGPPSAVPGCIARSAFWVPAMVRLCLEGKRDAPRIIAPEWR